jgi:hypothetical protein
MHGLWEIDYAAEHESKDGDHFLQIQQISVKKLGLPRRALNIPHQRIQKRQRTAWRYLWSAALQAALASSLGSITGMEGETDTGGHNADNGEKSLVVCFIIIVVDGAGGQAKRVSISIVVLERVKRKQCK